MIDQWSWLTSMILAIFFTDGRGRVSMTPAINFPSLDSYGGRTICKLLVRGVVVSMPLHTLAFAVFQMLAARLPAQRWLILERSKQFCLNMMGLSVILRRFLMCLGSKRLGLQPAEISF